MVDNNSWTDFSTAVRKELNPPAMTHRLKPPKSFCCRSSAPPLSLPR